MKLYLQNLIILSLLSTALPLHAQFVSKDITGDLGNSRSVNIADFNNDGNQDIYVGTGLEQNRLWLGNGNGTFINNDIENDAGNTIDSVVADFNNDGNQDIYVVNWYHKNQLWMGNGDGSFYNANIPLDPESGTSAQSTNATVGDVDNDGDIDLYVGHVGADNILWINDGHANFLKSSISGDYNLGGQPVMADVNNDGNIDIYHGYSGYNNPNSLWLGSGTGNFSQSDLEDDFCLDASGGCPGKTNTFGDIDNDGDLDLYSTGWYEWNLNNLWLNDGTGNFSKTHIENDYGYSITDTVMIDIDGDNDMDILSTMTNAKANHILINDGLGNFTQSLISDERDYSNAIGVADFNNDMLLDIYIANGDRLGGQNKLWLQDTLPPVIVLNGSNPVIVEVGTPYEEQSATCSDNVDIDCTPEIAGSVDTNKIGIYEIEYHVSDTSGNESNPFTRTVSVVDNKMPVITLIGEDHIEINQGEVYQELGATCVDNYDEVCEVVIKGNVNVEQAGEYEITYTAKDTSGNNAEELIRVVKVKEKQKKSSGSRRKPQINLDSNITKHTSTKQEIPTTETHEPMDPSGCTPLVTQDLTRGAMDGKYHLYTNGKVSEVKRLQSYLNFFGFQSGPEDGIFGPITDGAVKRMQSQYNTLVDGYVGPLTRQEINSRCSRIKLFRKNNS